MKPYIDNEVYEKTKRKGASAEEAARVASGMSRTLASAMAQKAPPPSKQGKADAMIGIRAKEQCFPPLLLKTLYKVVLIVTGEFVGEIVNCDHYNKSY